MTCDTQWMVNIVSKFGFVNADAVVFEELVVGVVEVVVTEVVGVVVGEDINLTGPLSLCIFSISLNILPYILIQLTSHIS